MSCRRMIVILIIDALIRPGLYRRRYAAPVGLLQARSRELDGAGLGAVEDERDRIDEQRRVGRAVIAIGRKHGGLERDQPALGEIEGAGGAALVVGKLDDDLAAVDRLLAVLD